MSILNRINKLEKNLKDTKKGVLFYIFSNEKLVETNEGKLSPVEKENATKIIIKRRSV